MQELLERLLENLRELVEQKLEDKIDYDRLRTVILLMLDDPRTDDAKLFRVLGRSGYDRQTVQHVLDAMRRVPKKVGPLEKKI